MKFSSLEKNALAAALFAVALGVAPAPAASSNSPGTGAETLSRPLPDVCLIRPVNNAVFNLPASICLSATASASDGTMTNLAFYQGTALLGNVSDAPYNFTWSNVSAGSYALTAVATDAGGASTTSSVVNVTVANVFAIQALKQIKTVFVIALENHDLTQAHPDGKPPQILGNPAAPYLNSLMTPGHTNAAQVSYATAYYNAARGEHPSEPNYVWSEAGTDFGIRTDNDPRASSSNIFTAQHLTGQLMSAGLVWKCYQEDLEYASSAIKSASGKAVVDNPYNGTKEYSYAVKHNPMEFFSDTQNQNVFPLTNLWMDLANNATGRYNWITPDQFNEMHSALPGGYNYNGVQYTVNQAPIAEGDNCLSIIIPKIKASAAYRDRGAIIIWVDETESTDDTRTTLPEIIISPMAKGNAYASSVVYSHSSDLKTMDEIFGLAFQTNAIPARRLNAAGTGYNYVAAVSDLSDMFSGVSGIASSENPSRSGDEVSFTANYVGDPAPAGTVQFKTNGAAFGASASLNNGQARFTVLLPHGTNLITAEYSGDSLHQPSTQRTWQTVTDYPPATGKAE